MANCLTCIHQEVCKERMEIFNLPNIACQYEAHELVGEWERSDNRWEVGTWRCSHCNSYYDVVTNYCPNCGADMMREGEAE